jgi:hypothetical protein
MEQGIDQSHSTSFTISGASDKPDPKDDCTYWQDSVVCDIDFDAYGYA